MNTDTIAFRRLLSAQFTPEDLADMIDDELKKSEPDSGLIDACLSKLLRQKEYTAPVFARGKNNMRRIVLFAAVIALIFSMIAAAAAICRNTTDSAFRLFSDRLRIVFETENTSRATECGDTALEKELSSRGFGNVPLPEAILQNADTEHIFYDTAEGIASADIPFSSDLGTGHVVLTKTGGTGSETVEYPDASDIQELFCGDIRVYVFGQKRSSSAVYNADGVQVEIILNGSTEDAIRLTETMKEENER